MMDFHGLFFGNSTHSKDWSVKKWSLYYLLQGQALDWLDYMYEESDWWHFVILERFWKFDPKVRLSDQFGHIIKLVQISQMKFNQFFIIIFVISIEFPSIWWVTWMDSDHFWEWNLSHSNVVMPLLWNKNGLNSLTL